MHRFERTNWGIDTSDQMFERLVMKRVGFTSLHINTSKPVARHGVPGMVTYYDVSPGPFEGVENFTNHFPS